MSKIYKIASVALRQAIGMLDGLNNKVFTDLYWRYLSKCGVKFSGRPNYISSSAYIDGLGLPLISIGEETVISREVMLLTHDYSVECALHAIGLGTDDRHLHTNEGITIGKNSFIGARASILPGSTIGDNCIVGACSVVKGSIPDGSIVIGNPARVVGSIDATASRLGKKVGVLIDLQNSGKKRTQTEREEKV